MSNDFDAFLSDAVENARAMQGWDFSYVNGRRHTDRHPWDYIETVCSRLGGIHDMLDMETGGGEVLLSLNERSKQWPDRVSATEGYAPNVAVARRNLLPIGAGVVECSSSDELPFKDESFDLITNRHGDFSESEVRRVLKPGGAFITQQIGFATKISFNDLLNGPDPSYERVRFEEFVSRFEDADFEIIDRQEYNGSDIFDDVGAVVFVLMAAPWEIPGFSVEQYRDQLYALHESIKLDGPIDVGVSFFLLSARKRR